MAKVIWRPPNPENANDGQVVVEGQQRNIVATDIAEKDDKLEIKNDDGAWFAAELTFKEDGITTVHFDDYLSDDDEQWDAEKIKSLIPISEHIRVVSEQLQDADCSIVSVNKIVCALRRIQDKEGWYDAVVTEMRTMPHRFADDGEFCPCTFDVIWRDGPGKGRTQRGLTCGDICVLSTKNVETHPLVVDILGHASGEGIGRDQEKEEGPSCSAPRVRRNKSDTDDDTESWEEQVYVRRRYKRLKPNVTDVSQANDPLEQSELVVDDQNAVTPSKENEIRDVSSLSSRPADKLIKENSLSSHSAKLIREITAEICGGADDCWKQSEQADDHLKQSEQADDRLKQSEQAVEATQFPDVSPLSPPAADSNISKKRMRGQVESESSVSSDLSDLRDRIFGVKSSEKVCKDEVQQRKVSPDVKSLDRVDENHEQKTKISPNAELIQERRVKPKVSMDLTEEAKCDLQVKKETFKAKAESLEERHLSSRPSEVQVKKEDVKRKAYFLDDNQLSSKSPETEAKADPILKQKKADGLAATDENKKAKAEAYLISKTTEILAAKSEAQRSKKVRITVQFDMDFDESASILEGASLNRSFPAGAKVTSYSSNCEQELLDSDGKSGAMSTTGKAAESKGEATLSGPIDSLSPEGKDEKLFQSSAKREKGWGNNREEEIPGSVDESFGGTKKKNPSVQLKIEDESKVIMHPCRGEPSGNEQELVDSKSQSMLGSAADNAICLSDDEQEDGITASSSIPPTSSTRGFPNSSSAVGSDYVFTTDDQQEGWNVHPQNNQARNRRSAFIKNYLAKSGCILMIDNLEVDVRESDLREQFLKFCDKEKIQSVTIPPPHAEMSRSIGYVIFVDKEAADTAARVLASCIVVSARGKPWVVKRHGQEDPGLMRQSDLMDDVQDGNALSTGRCKVLTKRQYSEFNAARQRLKVFKEHQKQARVMFQRHAQEDKNLDGDGHIVLHD